MERVDVVLVDDDSGVRWIVGQLLAYSGIKYVSASTAQEGLSLVRSCAPKLAVLDVRLGTESGIDLARQIRQFDQEVGLLFITGYNSSVVHEAEDLDIIGVCEKPFDLSVFINQVNTALQHS